MVNKNFKFNMRRNKIDVGSLDIFGINKIPLGEDPQGAEEDQSYGREFDVSPIFSFSNLTVVEALEEVIVDFATLKPTSQKYLPFNTLQILNNSGETIQVFINQNRDRPLTIPAGVIQPINNTIAPAINSILWKNLDTSASIAIGEIQFIVSRDNVTTDLIMKRFHQLFLKGRGLTKK